MARTGLIQERESIGYGGDYPRRLNNAVRHAFNECGAPGDFAGIDYPLGTFRANLWPVGAGVAKYRYRVRNRRVTVTCNWTIGGVRQRRQRTAEILHVG